MTQLCYLHRPQPVRGLPRLHRVAARWSTACPSATSGTRPCAWARTPIEGGSGTVPGRGDVLPARAVPALREPRVREGVPHRGVAHAADDGTIQIDKSKCIGCQFCAMACPYGVRYLNEEERVVEKCTLCEQRTAQGELPQCVSPVRRPAPAGSAMLEQGIESFEGPRGAAGCRRLSCNDLHRGSGVQAHRLRGAFTETEHRSTSCATVKWQGVEE